MDCQRIAGEELVEKYLNGRLEPAEQDAFETHLLECQQCLERTETLQMAHASLTERAHAIRMLPSKPVRHLQWAWVAIAAAVIAMCVVGLYQLRNKTRTQPQIVKQPSPQPMPVQSPTPQNATVEPHPKPPGSVEQKQAVKKPDSNNPMVRPNSVPSQMDHSIPQAPLDSQVAGSHQDNQPVHPSVPKEKTPSATMSEAAALELYRLAQVEAPATNLSVVSPGTQSPSNQNPNPSGLTPGTTTAGSARALFQKAMLAYIDKNYTEATELLKRSAELEPKAADVEFYLGICYLMAGHSADAVAPLKTVLSARPGVFTQPAHFYLAKAYLQLGNLAEAERQMQAASELPGRLTAEARSLLSRIQALRQQLPQDNTGIAKPN